jgi:acyl-CoA synthetase (AMP-forming)/AMP-acid ligase II
VETPPKRVFVICNEDEITRALIDAVAQHARERVTVLREPTDLRKADKVLLVLTPGVLSGDPLAQLKDTIHQDTAQQDRVVAMYSEVLGWSFGCPEHQGASPEVRECIDNHEAIAYRGPKDGNTQHEFIAMFNHLLIQFGAMPAGMLIAKRDEVPVPLSSLRERLDAAEQRDARHEANARAQLVMKDAEMQALAKAKDELAKAKDEKIQELQALLATMRTF